MATQTYTLFSERERGYAVAAVMKAKLGVEVSLGDPGRTRDQNARLHAMLTDISDQIGWPPDTGEIHDVVWWKRVLTLEWLIEERKEKQAHDDRPEVITSLDGDEYGILLPHTSDLKMKPMARLNQFVETFGAQHGVVFKEPPAPPPPEEAR